MRRPIPAVPEGLAGPAGHASAGSRGGGVQDPPEHGHDAVTLEGLEAGCGTAWVDSLAAQTAAFLQAAPARAAIAAAVQDAWEYEAVSPPLRRGERTFTCRNDGTRAQPLWSYRDGAGPGDETVLLDTLDRAADGSLSVGDFAPSPDGRCVAYTLHDRGSDDSELHVLDVDTKLDRAIVGVRCRWGGIAWLDAGRFAFSVPSQVEGSGEAVHVFDVRRADAPPVPVTHMPQGDGVYCWCQELPGRPAVVCYAALGTDPRHGVWLLHAEDGHCEPILPPGEASLLVVGSDGEDLVGVTDSGAANGRLVGIDVRRPEPVYWRTILPSQDGAVMDDAAVLGESVLVSFLADGWSSLALHPLLGGEPVPVSLPGLGIAKLERLTSRRVDLFVAFFSVIQPPELLHLAMAGGRPRLNGRTRRPANYDAGRLHAVQRSAVAEDGALIPVTIVSKGPLDTLASPAPTLLYTYGGFAVPSTHGLNPFVHVWVMSGGLYVIASVRGGNEKGIDWHRSAVRADKPRTFADLRAVAAWLTQQPFCAAGRLGVFGVSGGGLVAAAAMVGDPTLFDAVVCEVAPLDMLRFHLHGIGAGWIPEYGSPDIEEERAALLTFSPVHNVMPDVAYPPILVSTADHDVRVQPWHSYKFVLQLRRSQSPHVYLRVEQDTGHWSGATTDVLKRRVIDRLCFLSVFLAAGRSGGDVLPS